jgi:hypothetical protein
VGLREAGWYASKELSKEQTMPKKPRHKKSPGNQQRAVSYVVDMEAGEHRYVFVEGVGECLAMQTGRPSVGAFAQQFQSLWLVAPRSR